jgi:hypothetical protein
MAPPEPLEALPVQTLAEVGKWWGVSSSNRVRSGALSLGVAPGTVRSWSTGYRPRHGFELERHKDGASLWWKVTHQ